jgi:hypothetical protein
MNYDAIQVAITALDRLPVGADVVISRPEIQKIISDSKLIIPGIAGEISFIGSDRTQSINSLVQPICDATRCAGLQTAR